MKKTLAFLFLLGLAAPAPAGFSLGRPAAVKKRVDKLDDKVRAAARAPASPDRPPVFSASAAVSTTVAAGGYTRVSAAAADPDGDTVTYVWTSTAGVFQGSGAAPYWLAPAVSGVYTLSCAASDGSLSVSTSVVVTAVAPGTPKWDFSAANPFSLPPVPAPDGTVYVSDSGGVLYALDGAGAQKWSYTTAAALNYPPVVSADGMVYAVDSSDNVYAVRPDGTLKWSNTTLPAVTVDASPVVGPDGGIYVYDGTSAALYSLDPVTGVEVSTFTDLSGILVAPVAGPNGSIYVAANDGVDDVLYAVPAAGLSGSTPTIVTGITMPPAVGADGSVYWLDLSNNLNAATAAGSTKWAAPFSYIPSLADVGPLIGLDGGVYVLDSGSGVIRVSSETGVGFAFSSSFAAVTQPAASGRDGAVYAVSTADLAAARSGDTALWGPVTAAPPATAFNMPSAVADGTVYVTDDNGAVYAFYSSSLPPSS